jgi:CHAT domain-containing protein
MFSSLHLADGWITVRDICRQRLTAGLVILSACETGLSGLVSGEEIVGLIRGFLSAGAGAMVVSLWTVNDAATTQLMKGFYRELQPGRTVSAALTAAQRDFVRRGVHPYYWSPFITVGP